MREDQRRNYPSFPAKRLIEIIEGVESVFIKRERMHVCVCVCNNVCVRAQVGGCDPGIL